MTPRPGQRALAVPVGRCPDCGRGIGVILDEQGEPAGVSHFEPTCPQFVTMEADAFLAWVRVERERARPVGEA